MTFLAAFLGALIANIVFVSTAVWLVVKHLNKDRGSMF